MKYCILNLPHKRKIIRKYSCSFYANGFLYPPIELLRVATIIKQNMLLEEDSVFFIDAIAEGYSYKKCTQKLIELAPEYIFTLISVDFSNDEKDFISILKKKISSNIIAIGYLPELFPKAFPQFDIILGSDFENRIFWAFERVKGLNLIDALRDYDEKFFFNADIISGCDYSFLSSKKYYEFLAKGKTAFTYFSFGCPFKCSYCIRTYNLRNVYFRNTATILNELAYFAREGYDNIRILDDNCTLNKPLLKSIKEFCIKENLKFNFYGLTRIDLIDDEVIKLIKDVNFKRILIGIESFNEQRIKEYNKGTSFNIDMMKDNILRLVNAGIEVGVFLLFNPLKEDRKDVTLTLKILQKLPIQFAGISYLIPYPGTPFFDENKENIQIEFSPNYSVKYKYKTKSLNKYTQYYFFLTFYILNNKRLTKTIGLIFIYPKRITEIIKEFLFFLFNQKNDRTDFL